MQEERAASGRCVPQVEVWHETEMHAACRRSVPQVEGACRRWKASAETHPGILFPGITHKIHKIHEIPPAAGCGFRARARRA